MQAVAPLAAQALQAVGMQVLLQPATANAAAVVVGIVRPAYLSAAAADGPATPAADAERRRWGRYWATLAACGLLEAAVFRLVDGSRSSPPPPPPSSSSSSGGGQLTYAHARLALLIWLASPRTRGAARLYAAAVRPLAAAASPFVASVSADVAAILEKTGLSTLAEGISVALYSIPGVCWLLGGDAATAPPPDGQAAEWSDPGGRGARAARAARKAVGGVLGAAKRVVTGGGGGGGK